MSQYQITTPHIMIAELVRHMTCKLEVADLSPVLDTPFVLILWHPKHFIVFSSYIYLSPCSFLSV